MSKTNKPINSFWRFALILVATGATGAGLEANTEIQSNLISQANTEQKSRQFESALESKDLEIKKLEKEAGDYVDNKRAIIMDNRVFSKTLEKANELVSTGNSNEFKKAPVAVASYKQLMTNKGSPSIRASSKTTSYTSDITELVKNSAERRSTISKENKKAPVKEGPGPSGLKR